MLRVDRIIGAEGPKEDPYSFTEWHIEKDNQSIVAHFGLLEYVKINNITIADGTDSQNVQKIFEDLIGIHLHKLEKVYYRTKFTCKQCNTYNNYHCVGSYPGETLYICNKCNNVIAVDFDKSAVE